jgi:predicted DNA-binding protein
MASPYTEPRETKSMTLTLELPPDLEERLKAEAARRGLSTAEYLLELARSAISHVQGEENVDAEELEELLTSPWPPDEPRPTNGAELVAYWQRHGLIGSRPDITNSLEYVQAMRRKAEMRDWS